MPKRSAFKRKKLSAKQYFGARHQLIAYLTGAPLRLHLDDTINVDIQTFIQAEALAQKHKLDLSGALQIITIENGRFKERAHESKTLLATADGGLAKAAEHEGLRFWNVLETAEPPDC